MLFNIYLYIKHLYSYIFISIFSIFCLGVKLINYFWNQKKYIPCKRNNLMKPSDFIHPEDAAALRQMESIPGFAAIIKKILAIGLENLQYGINMATTIRPIRCQT